MVTRFNGVVYSFFFIISQYVPIKKPSTIKKRINIVLQKPTVARKIPIIPATIAPIIPLLNFTIGYFIQFKVVVKDLFAYIIEIG